ncbi:hypothetical protein BJX70DRAFT_332696 [Aspergillus crustosus]
MPRPHLIAQHQPILVFPRESTHIDEALRLGPSLAAADKEAECSLFFCSRTKNSRGTCFSLSPLNTREGPRNQIPRDFDAFLYCSFFATSLISWESALCGFEFAFRAESGERRCQQSRYLRLQCAIAVAVADRHEHRIHRIPEPEPGLLTFLRAEAWKSGRGATGKRNNNNEAKHNTTQKSGKQLACRAGPQIRLSGYSQSWPDISGFPCRLAPSRDILR